MKALYVRVWGEVFKISITRKEREQKNPPYG